MPAEQKKVAAGWGWSLSAMLMAFFGAVVPGYLNTHVTPLNDHLSVEAIVAIGLISTIAGSLSPRLFWVSATLIALGLPVFHLATQVLGVQVPRPLPPNFADLLALVPALLCAAAGAGWRLFFTQPITRPRRHN